MPKNQVKEKLVWGDPGGILTGTVDDIIQNLTELKKRYLQYKLEIELDAGYNNINMDIYGWRDETLEERNYRLAQAKKEIEQKAKKAISKRQKLIAEAKKLGLRLIEE